MRSISSRMLLWIGATALVLFVIGIVVTNQIKQGLWDSALKDTRQREISFLMPLYMKS